MQDLNIDFTFWFLQTLTMMITALLIPGLRVSGPIPALATVIALAFVNSHAWNAALFFHIPDSLTFQTLLLILTNGVIFWIIVKLLPGIEIEGVLPAILAPLVFTGCSILVGKYGSQIDWMKLLERTLEYTSQIRSYFEESHLPTHATPIPN